MTYKNLLSKFWGRVMKRNKIYELMRQEAPINESKPSDVILGTNMVGIEVEVEDARVGIIHKKYKHWKIVHDGSLRNGGIEFVFAGPKGGKDAEDALDELFDVKKEDIPTINERCGIHVHVDVRDLTAKQLKSFCLLAVMFEEVFMAKTGERSDNIFCCKFSTSDIQLEFISNIEKMSKGNYYRSFGKVGKYASVNFLCLETFGSIEFRYHKGSFNKEEITIWVNTLLSLKEYALRSDIEPDNLTNSYSALGGCHLFNDVMGDFLFKHYYTNDMDAMLLKGMRLAQDGMLYGRLVRDREGVMIKLRTPDYVHPAFKRFIDKRKAREDGDDVPMPPQLREGGIRLGDNDEAEQPEPEIF